jgi:5-methylthioribose kinase
MTERAAPVFFDTTNRAEIERYVVACGLVPSGDLPIEIAAAGAGNMNLVLRVTPASGRSFILKQGRPWVEKYPQITAPIGRTLVEAAFYSEVQVNRFVASRMPAVLHVDSDNQVLALEDAGATGDFTSIYANAALPPAAVGILLQWLEELAGVPISAERRPLFANREMRALNHEHMFRFPLLPDNGLSLDDITPGVSDSAGELASHRAYCEAVSALGQRYLSDGPTLVHGDYFPGSWLKASDGLRVIDPEFCFLGDPEFDCGILAAHLTIAQCDPEALTMVAASAERRHLDLAVVAAYAGVEIMRRLIGVAQLPLVASIARKRMLLQRSVRLLLEPDKGLS